MPGAEAEAKAAAMDNAVDVWRLNTASRLHMVCTWWEWKCSESNWQTIALVGIAMTEQLAIHMPFVAA